MYILNIYPASLVALFQGFIKPLIIKITLLALLKDKMLQTHKTKKTLEQKGKVQMQLKMVKQNPPSTTFRAQLCYTSILL